MKEKKIKLKHDERDLKKLVMLMNKQNRRFIPPVRTVLESLDYALTGDELRLLLRMGNDRYSYEQALAVSGIDAVSFAPLLDTVIRKGYVEIKYRETGEEEYTLQPFVVGWFEAHVAYLVGKPEEKEFARRWMRFYTSFRSYNYFPLRNIMNKRFREARITNQSVGSVNTVKDSEGRSIINIDQRIDVPASKIYPTSSVIDMLQDYGTNNIIGQLTCMCRRITLNIGDPCRFNRPDDGGCIALGEKAKPFIKYGYARQISKEEAFDIIQKVRDHGAIHTVFHERDDARQYQMAICNCCWDCCGILRTYNMGAAPLRYNCFYIAEMKDSGKCSECKKPVCEIFCPTAAITVAHKEASINRSRCIGCGQCVHQCTQSAVELKPNKRTAFLPILKKSAARIKL